MYLSVGAAPAASADACLEFKKLIRETYNFKPSQMTDAERNAKSDAMDKVWKAVEANQKELLPCLREALDDAGANAWFRFDGSNLLVKLDQSPESKAVQVREHLTVDLGDVNLRHWTQVIARRGAEGFDVSEAGVRWLGCAKAKYYLPEHGAYEVNKHAGALFIFGSMKESQAMPALLGIIAKPNDPEREFALWMLAQLATPESIRALKKIDLSTFSERSQQQVRTLLTAPVLLKPRDSTPKVTREEYVKAFQDASLGKWKSFNDLVDRVPDGEKDAVAVLKEDDLPLLRQVRRLRISYCNQHGFGLYRDFTSIIMALVWKPELVK